MTAFSLSYKQTDWLTSFCPYKVKIWQNFGQIYVKRSARLNDVAVDPLKLWYDLHWDMIQVWSQIWLLGLVLRIYVAISIFQPYRDLEARDNQSSCSTSQELNHYTTAMFLIQVRKTDNCSRCISRYMDSFNYKTIRGMQLLVWVFQTFKFDGDGEKCKNMNKRQSAMTRVKQGQTQQKWCFITCTWRWIYIPNFKSVYQTIQRMTEKSPENWVNGRTDIRRRYRYLKSPSCYTGRGLIRELSHSVWWTRELSNFVWWIRELSFSFKSETSSIRGLRK